MSPMTDHLPDPVTADPAASGPRDTARQTLALRIAHRNRLRAERLARLRFPAPEGGAGEAGGTEETGSVAAAPVTVPGLAEAATGSALLTRRPPQETAAADLPPPAAPKAGGPLSAAEAADASDALEEFLRVLSGSMADPVVPVDEPEPAAILQFQRPGPATDPAPAHMPRPLAAPVCDLDRLRGVGPGLIWALNRAGIACLAEMALLEAEDLTVRLGPLGRLVPAAAWIATARAAEAD